MILLKFLVVIGFLNHFVLSRPKTSQVSAPFVRIFHPKKLRDAYILMIKSVCSKRNWAKKRCPWRVSKNSPFEGGDPPMALKALVVAALSMMWVVITQIFTTIFMEMRAYTYTWSISVWIKQAACKRRSCLEQLKQFTTVVADTGDFEGNIEHEYIFNSICGSFPCWSLFYVHSLSHTGIRFKNQSPSTQFVFLLNCVHFKASKLQHSFRCVVPTSNVHPRTVYGSFRAFVAYIYSTYKFHLSS